MDRNELLDKVARALDTQSPEAAFYYDRTTGEVEIIFDEVFSEVFSREDLPEWERELYDVARNHDLVKIEPVPSYEKYRHMERFIGMCGNVRVADRLQNAINRKRPFANFKDALFRLGIIDRWNEYHDALMKEYAESWIKENIEGYGKENDETPEDEE
ncbi:MAG: hypothetical protein IJ202_10545 [Bacteroidales bacterium]|nr:hypothetical protein [Bacteroidales bacterium]